MLYSKGAVAKQALEKVQISYDGTAKVYEAQQKVVKLADDRVSNAVD